jgi:hypothetical protein
MKEHVPPFAEMMVLDVEYRRFIHQEIKKTFPKGVHICEPSIGYDLITQNYRKE